jgi:hypothetical protein
MAKYKISDESLNAFQVDTFKILENSYKKELSSGNIKDAKDYFTILHIIHSGDQRIGDIPKSDYNRLGLELDDLLESGVSSENYGVETSPEYKISDEVLDGFKIDAFKILENSYKKELSSENIKNARDYFELLHILHSEDSRIGDIPKSDYEALDLKLNDLLQIAKDYSRKKD